MPSASGRGPEAALTLFIPLGAAGIAYIVPISTSIIVLLAIVCFSYRQTIQAYPGGGGSYTVARQNLGVSAGLLAAAALMIDYVLVVAVGISAGVGALVSAVPRLQPWTLLLCLMILAVITLVNLRGVRETGLLFTIPTYVFVGCLFLAILLGVVRSLASGGHPIPVALLPRVPLIGTVPSLWLMLQAFASGCTAMTGVEAVSKGVKAFREPVVPTARRTLTIIIVILSVLLAGIAYLVHAYGIAATIPGQPGYQSILSMLLGAVAGRGTFYYVSITKLRQLWRDVTCRRAFHASTAQPNSRAAFRKLSHVPSRAQATFALSNAVAFTDAAFIGRYRVSSKAVVSLHSVLVQKMPHPAGRNSLSSKNHNGASVRGPSRSVDLASS